MQLFIDTADIKQIREAWSWGIIDGVTTNPTLADVSLLSQRDLMLQKNCGRKTVEEIEQVLALVGLKLAGNDTLDPQEFHPRFHPRWR